MIDLLVRAAEQLREAPRTLPEVLEAMHLRTVAAGGTTVPSVVLPR